MALALFRQLAAYNKWANARIYAAALALPEDAYRRPTGVFFGSLHGTLNHLLVTDRIWLHRLTGTGDAPDRLDAILFEDRAALTRARLAEDARLIALIDTYDAPTLARPIAYRTMAGKPHEQPLADLLAHLFNHQTHHRGQAHACCSIVSGTEPPSLDLLAFQRGIQAPDLAALI
jgi:uncharacterized damage-inducible protein DinB